MLVEQSVLVRALTWLVSHQGPQGDFGEVGVLIHTEMQGGLDHGPVALTAYVTMALLEDKTYAVSTGCLRGIQTRGAVTYVKCLGWFL